MKVPIRSVDSVTVEVDAMHQQIASRAEQLHDRRGGGAEKPFDDWLAAERETVWKAPFEVQQTNGEYVVRAAVAGLAPGQLEVRIAPTDVLITAQVNHQHKHTGDALLCEFSPGPLFRSYHFAHPVVPGRAKADCSNGLLRITVPIARARKR